MTHSRDDSERAAREAADWATRFNGRATDIETLEAFARWRRHPENARAYDRVEAAWTRATTLGADRDIAEATRDALARGAARPRGAARIRTHSVAVALVASLVVGLVVLFLNRPATYTTAVGEQRLVRLADGSRVHINTDSKLRVRLGSGRRDLTLVRGEAFFEVAHDAARPFVVETDRGRVVATGTRFDVDRRDTDTRVTLTEGRVRIYDGPDADTVAVILRPGESIRLGLSPRGTPERTDTAIATSWLGGQLVFHQTPLLTAIGEMNRYTERKIRLDAPGLAHAQVDGRFDTGDVESFILAVTALFPLRAVTGADGRITLTATA